MIDDCCLSGEIISGYFPLDYSRNKVEQKRVLIIAYQLNFVVPC